jgi:hypothetical protein
MNEQKQSGQTIATEGRESYDGDMILQSDHIMGKKDGVYNEAFSHVSGIWLQQCKTFDAAKAELVNQQQQIEDFHAPLSEWEVVVVEEGVAFRHLATGRDYRPTDHALNLMCSVGKGMSSWTVRSLRDPIPHDTKKDEDGEAVVIEGGERGQADYEVLRDYIKVHLFNAKRVDQDKPRLFRTWSDGTLRALLSEQYQIVNNVWFLDVLSKAIPGGIVSHWNGDADSIYGNVLIPDTIRQETDSDFGGMLSVGNSEIGTRRISSLPSVFRAICMNGCILDQEFGKGISKVHRGKVDFAALEVLIIENLEAQIPLLPQGIERVLGLRAFGCDDTPLPNLLAQTAIDYSLSKKQVAEVYNGWNEEIRLLGRNDGKTAYGLVNGITRAGQRLDNNDQWVRFDTIGGEFASLDRDGWDAFRNRADNLSPKQVEKRLPELVVA